MTITIPARDISIEDKKHFRSQTIQAGIARALNRGLAPSEHELIYRDLAPEDLGLTAWATPAMQGGPYTTWISHTIVNKCYICIYKVIQLSSNPTVTSLRFWQGPRIATIGIHELEACYSGLPIIKNLAKALMSPEAKEVIDRLAGRDGMEISPDFGAPMEAYFSQPYVFDQDCSYVIEVKSRKNSPGDCLVLGGYVIEPVGMTIV